MSFVDPDQFIISRKRKKYKFALFNNSALCFELNEWTKRRVDCVEIGAGDGLFSVELALIHQDQVFAAIDVKGDRLQKGARRAEELGLRNIFFIRARADQLGELFKPNSLSAIWLTFSDPFPRKRSAGRRLTHPRSLSEYSSLLTKGGSLLLKHDDDQFFSWSLEQLVACGWQIKELSFDLHDSSLKQDYKLMTTYERRWLGEGKNIGFVRASAII